MADHDRGPGNRASGAKSGGSGEDGVIIEFHRVGNAVKVSAVDTRTYLEVSITAPVTASEKQMTDAVLKKLDYVRARKAAPGKPGGAGR